MDDSVLDDFCKCLDPKYVLEVETLESLEKNRALFANHAVDFIRRMSENYYEHKRKKSEPIFYYTIIRDKLRIRMDEYFEIHRDFVLYKKNKSIRVQPVQNDNLPSEAANAQYHALLNVIDHLNHQITGPPKKSQVSNLDPGLDSPKSKRVRRPTAESFVLAHTDVNLGEVFRVLSANSFIAPACRESFLQAFSGEPVNNKVIWFEANSLQYFIKEIYSKGGIEKTPEGKWVRTIKCFKKQDRDFTVGDLQDTHEPVASVTRILDRATELINNPR